jgi:outer membrane protein, multidrug efflux system
MRIIQRQILALVFLIIAGLSFAESPQLPGAWKTHVAASSVSSDNWWTVFEDKSLTQMIEEARATYPGLKTVMARIEKARAGVRAANAGRYPQISINNDFGRSRGSDTLYQFSFGTLNNFITAADISYEVDLWGRVRGQISAAQSQEKGAVADAQALGLLLASEVARVYFSLRALDEEKLVLADTLKLRQEALDLAKQRVNAGATNALDLVRAEAELASTEAELAALVAPRAELENTLALALGKMASDFKVGSNSLPAANPKIPKLLPGELVSRRPDVASASRLVEAAQSRIGVARATYLPKVTLGGGAGLQTSQADRFFDRESGIWSLGLKVSIPIFGGGQRKAAMELAHAQLKEATGEYEEKVLTAFKEVESLLAALKAQETQAEVQERLQKAADEAAKLARQRYSEGVAGYLEVIEAERTALGARRAMVQLRGQRLLTAVQLIKALGGGWQSE